MHQRAGQGDEWSLGLGSWSRVPGEAKPAAGCRNVIVATCILEMGAKRKIKEGKKGRHGLLLSRDTARWHGRRFAEGYPSHHFASIAHRDTKTRHFFLLLPLSVDRESIHPSQDAPHAARRPRDASTRDAPRLHAATRTLSRIWHSHSQGTCGKLESVVF